MATTGTPDRRRAAISRRRRNRSGWRAAPLGAGIGRADAWVIGELTSTRSRPASRPRSSVGERANASVDIAPAVDRHRPEVAGHGARRRHRLSDRHVRGIRSPEHHPLAVPQANRAHPERLCRPPIGVESVDAGRDGIGANASRWEERRHPRPERVGTHVGDPVNGPEQVGHRPHVQHIRGLRPGAVRSTHGRHPGPLVGQRQSLADPHQIASRQAAPKHGRADRPGRGSYQEGSRARVPGRSGPPGRRAPRRGRPDPPNHRHPVPDRSARPGTLPPFIRFIDDSDGGYQQFREQLLSEGSGTTPTGRTGRVSGRRYLHRSQPGQRRPDHHRHPDAEDRPLGHIGRDPDGADDRRGRHQQGKQPLAGCRRAIGRMRGA